MLVQPFFSQDEHGEDCNCESRLPCYASESAMEQLRESNYDTARLLGRVEVRLYSSPANHKVGGVPVPVLRDTSAPGKSYRFN